MSEAKAVTVLSKPEPAGARKPLPDGWQWAKLGDVCLINPRRPEINRGDDELTTFVQMSAVEESGKGVARVELKPFAEVRKGYTYFGEGDVLFAKITPCMQNGKHALVRNLTNGIGFGSTEFHVLRARCEVISDWIHQFIIQPSVLLEASAHFKGAVGQQRVPEDFLAGLLIPLPPLPEQKRIVKILTEQMAAVEKARAAAEAQLNAAKVLPAAYLRSVFENEESKGWPRKSISDLMLSGIIIEHQDGNHGELHPRSKDFIDSGIRFVTAKHIKKNGALALDKAPCISPNQSSKLRIGFAQADDVLLAHNATVGPVSIAPRGCDPFVVGTSLTIYRCDVDQMLPGYLVAALKADEFQRQLIDAMKQTTRNQVPITRQRQLTIPLTTHEEQERVVKTFTEKMEAVEQLQNRLEAMLDSIKLLPGALLGYAFNGEL